MTLDERPSERGRVPGRLPEVVLRETEDVTVEGILVIDDSMKEYITET